MSRSGVVFLLLALCFSGGTGRRVQTHDVYNLVDRSEDETARPCRDRLNIIFLLDGSSSVSSRDFSSMKRFVKKIADGLDLGSRTAAAAVVQFASKAREEIQLTTDRDRFSMYLRGVSQLKGGTDAYGGMKLVKKMLATTRRKHNTKQVVVLLADGDADANAEWVAREIEEDHQGLIFTVAIGSHADKDGLQMLASGPGFFFEVTDFQHLTGIVSKLSTSACDLEKPTGWEQPATPTIAPTTEAAPAPPPTPDPSTSTITTTMTTTSTTLPEICAIQETQERFRPLYDKWTLIAALGQKLEYESELGILRTFQDMTKKAFPNEYQDIRSPIKYARALGEKLLGGSQSVSFAAARRVQAEWEEFYNLGLNKYSGRVSEEQHEKLLDLENDLCTRMATFIHETSQDYYQTNQIFRDSDLLWNIWQRAWGPVRIYVKVTTQCRVKVPADQSMTTFLSKPEEWTQCSGVEPWAPGQFPSAVMACARPDGEHVNTEEGPTIDRDRMIRYLGCGGNRLKTRDGTFLEPPIGQGVSEGCSQNSEDASDWMKAMCGAGSVSTAGGCRMYGPFWAVYSAPLESLYGSAGGGDEECALSGETGCSNPQVEAFRGMAINNPMSYIYGSLPPLEVSQARGWKDAKAPVGWEEQTVDFPFPEERRLDPPMWELLREAEAGNNVMMIAYGYSGSGKTTTLIGDAGAPVGGAYGLDGVLSIYLRENANRIKHVRMRVVEIYARFDGRDGRLMVENGGGLWGYKLKSESVQYIGPSSAFADSDGRVDFAKLEKILADKDYTLNLNETVSQSTSGRMDWGTEVKKKLMEIEKIRMNAKEFKSGGEELAHIRATPNNPKSSRGSLVVITEIDFVSGETGSVAVIDLAGAEDPAVLVEGFMSFMPADVDGCISRDMWTPSGPEASSKKLTQKFMHQMDSYGFLNDKIGECVRMRDFLVECDRKKPKPECVDIQLSSGRKYFMRPDPMADVKWTYKTFRSSDQQEDFVFTIDNRKISFTEAEVQEALAKGPVKGMNKLKRSSSLTAKKKCGKTETEKCPGSWAERLWARCGENEDGKCVAIGQLDGLVLKKKLDDDDFGFMEKGKKKVGAIRALTGIVKDVITFSGSQRGKAFRRGDKPTEWVQERERFWRELHEYTAKYDKKEQMMDDLWELHLKYFVSAVGPMVQESIYINEALNQMKSYLGAWASESMDVEPGQPLNLWPVRSMSDQAKNPQIIDTTPGSRYVEEGYDLYRFVMQHGADESFAMKASDGKDEVMMLTMLEYLRRLAASRGKESKVLFGAFVRTDEPGADPDCDGAKVSLEFAQSLSEAVGWKRSDSLHHLV